jgi:hypothetical protein
VKARPKRSVGSAVGRLLAVFDDAASAERVAEALRASGIGSDRIERFAGDGDLGVFDASGERRGWRGRLYRIVEFSWADQAPDFAWYEAAIREGRIVLSVRVRGDRAVRAVAAIVATAGGHFVNHFGWFETREIARWRGKEPDLPGFLRR